MVKQLKKFPKKKLPTTLSGWIKTAVKDAQALAKLPGFALDMYTYNSFDGDDVCHVCLGGACIVNRGLRAPGSFTGPDSSTSAAVASALDHVRRGKLQNAARTLFQAKLIAWVPTESSMMRAGDLIERRFLNYLKGRASWDAYLEAAEIVKHKPQRRSR